MRKAINIINKSIDRIILIASFLLFLICLYAMVDAYMVYRGASDPGLLKYKPDLSHPETLGELSEDAIAWITVDGTDIDYPVMQGKTNEEYLNKDPYGSFSLSGSIFLDSRNDRFFSDGYSLVYGHHMEYGAMFGALDRYLDREYFDTHRTGTLISVNGTNYRINLFASCKAQATDKIIFNPTETGNDELLEYLKAGSVIYYNDAAGTDSKFIGLSTCQSAENLERIIVFGTLTEI